VPDSKSHVPQPKPAEQLSGLVCVLHTLVHVPEQVAFWFGGGDGQHALVQQAVEHDDVSHVHWLTVVSTQWSPGVEHVPPLAAVHVPPAPSIWPQVFDPLQLGVLHAPW